MNRRQALLGAAVLGPAARAQPTRSHALLVGVADYPLLPRRLWLHGPVNDVALMATALRVQGVPPERTTRLVSRSGSEPTRAAILQAMQATQARARAGDRVYFYLAGHGSQQPQPAAPGARPVERDGWDEVFLPADVDRWSGRRDSAMAIPNALLDDEIGEWFDRLVDSGVEVWGLFDTCHAAGMARGPGARWRALPSLELGLPAAARRPPAVRHGLSPRASRTDGRTLLFAAQAHEPAAEEWMPRHSGAPALHGVFTYHLAQLMLRGEALRADGLRRGLEQAYRREGRASPTPVVIGPSRT